MKKFLSVRPRTNSYSRSMHPAYKKLWEENMETERGAGLHGRGVVTKEKYV